MRHAARPCLASPVLAGLALAFTLFATTMASAEVSAQFSEGSPHDRFVIRYAGGCDAGPIRLAIDLSGSAGRLYFDTTATGAGVSAHQPFRLVAGAERVVSVTAVGDGDTAVVFALSGLAPGDVISFTTDLDDRLAGGPMGQTQIDGTEMAGALLRLDAGGAAVEAVFDAAGRAVAPWSPCLS